jgi:hypothetical protein
MTSHRAFLKSGGFKLRGVCSSGTTNVTMIISGNSEPKKPGVYAFVVDGEIRYIGSAQRGLHERLGHYQTTQGRYTAARVRAEVLKVIMGGKKVEVFTYMPNQTTIIKNNLPVDLVAGIETALLRKFKPTWNKRGLGPPVTADSMQ